MLRLQRTAGNRAVGRLLSDARRSVARDFYEYVPTTAKHVWHAEGVTPEYVAVGRKFKGPDDYFSWSVYVRRDASPLDANVAVKVLRSIYPEYAFVTGKVVFQTHEEWAAELLGRNRPDDGSASFSGYTAGFEKAPAERDVRVHKGRQKLDTLVHELVHANAVENFDSLIGTFLNEGFTELLAQHAMRKTGFVPHGHYRDAVPAAEKITAKIGIPALAEAWFKDGVAGLDKSLEAKGIDLVKLAEATGHEYRRVLDIADLGLDLEPIVVHRPPADETKKPEGVK